MSKDKDMEYMQRAFRKSINQRFKPQPEWEDEHPILTTILVLSAILFNPVSLFMIFMFLFFIILTWGIFF